MLFKIGLQTPEHKQYWHQLFYIDKRRIKQQCMFITPEHFYNLCNMSIKGIKRQFSTHTEDKARIQSLQDCVKNDELLPVPVISLVGSTKDKLTPAFFDGLHRMYLSYELYGNIRQPVIIITEADKPEQLEVVKNGTKYYHFK